MPTIFVHIQQTKKRLALHIKSHLYVTYIVISLGTKTSKHDHMPTITSRMQQSKTNLARCVAVTTAAYIPFSHARHKGITAPRHFNDYSSSNATRRAAHSNTICWRGMWAGSCAVGGVRGVWSCAGPKNAASQDDFINTFLQGLNSSNWG